jgi:mannan endo-1,4-beta-mannosidase
MMSARHRFAVVTLAATVSLVLAGCGGGGGSSSSSAAGTQSQPTATSAATPAEAPPVNVPVTQLFSGKGMPIGIYEKGFPGTTEAAASFTAATGVQPRMLSYYSGWGQGFATTFAEAAHASGAVPVVQLEPTDIPLGTIAAGQSDDYLREFAQAVRAFRYPVILSFGHEMNGNWYSWGDTHAQPADFVAAWQHVVSVFRGAGAINAKWLWTVNGITDPSFNLRPWWPGQEWVDLVGIDAYYYTANDTFHHVFGPTLAAVHQFSTAPVLIAETAIGGNPKRESQIHGLLAGATTNHIFGIIWFDVAQNDGLYHQNWHLETDPAAVTAFKEAVKGS